ncbi:metabotropic glutamate receptor 1 [Hydra vulgaris]|uniref:metabotropic glutamate receptor 1 n=1 Tax=Hydra vulgaris TaxID=6087 RepID=UPI001F5F5B29|nr:metabotropic glutamate receptor 1-like [Hydra vulgaris]
MKWAAFIILVFSHQIIGQTCNRKKIESKGDIIIFGMFPIQYCDKNNTDDTSIVWAEAMKYTINEANKQQGKNLFGYTIYDSENYAELDGTTSATIDILFQLNTNNIVLNQQGSCLNSILNRTLGLVGPTDSTNSINVHRLTSFTNIAIVSYSATSTELSNKELYPNFFRTMPTDSFQVQFIIDLLLYFNWTYVSIIATDSSYGRNGAFLLQEMFSTNGICMSKYVSIGDDYDEIEYKNALFNITDDNRAKVVIFYGTVDSAKNILADCLKHKIKDLNWILSESNLQSNWLLDFKKQYNGNIMMIILCSEGFEKFKSTLLSTTYKNSDDWLRTLFEKNSQNKLFPDMMLGDVNNYLDFSWVSYVQTAVNVLIKSFLKYVDCNKNLLLCNSSLIENRKHFNNIVKNITFLNFDDSLFQFDKNQDPLTVQYDFYIASNESFLFTGTWSSIKQKRLEIKESKILQSVSSKCSEPCPPGQFAVINLQLKCCWICTFCDENYVKGNVGTEACKKCKLEEDYYSNINRTRCIKLHRTFWSFREKEQITRLIIAFLFSMIGVTISIAFIIVFVIKKNTPLVRSSNYKFSLGQMGAHLTLFIIPILSLEEDTKLKCVTRTYLGGLLFFSIIILTLLKVTHLIAVFGAFKKLSKKDMMRIRFKEILFFFLAILIYATMVLVVENMYPLDIIEDKNTDTLTIYKFCDSGKFLTFHIVCVFILLIVCAVQTYRGRKLPWKFNEAKYIAFGMFTSTLVQIISIFIGLSSLDPMSNTFLLWLSTNLSNLLLFAILFGFKLKVILFNPEKNTVKRFRKVTTAVIYGSHFLPSIPQVSKQRIRNLSISF